MNNDPIRLQNPSFLPHNLFCHLYAVGQYRELRREFRGTEQPAVLDGIKGCIGKNIQSAGFPQIDPLMFEDFLLQVAKIHSDRYSAQIV